MRPTLVGLILLSACGASGTLHHDAARPAASRPAPVRAASLLQAEAADVVRALGRPSLRRSEGSAEVWLYTARDGCRLDLVLYSEAGGAKVAHAQTRAPAPDTEAACLGRIAGGG